MLFLIMRFLIISFISYFLYLLVFGTKKRNKNKTSFKTANIKENNLTKELVKDSYDGVYFPKEEAFIQVIEGQTHYFSSLDNMNQYLESEKKRESNK